MSAKICVLIIFCFFINSQRCATHGNRQTQSLANGWCWDSLKCLTWYPMIPFTLKITSSFCFKTYVFHDMTPSEPQPPRQTTQCSVETTSSLQIEKTRKSKNFNCCDCTCTNYLIRIDWEEAICKYAIFTSPLIFWTFEGLRLVTWP